jgi:hypothetical protein
MPGQRDVIESELGGKRPRKSIEKFHALVHPHNLKHD